AGIFVISVWNGASYYVEVFGRRFEKELLELRREMEMIKTTESVVSGVKKGDRDGGEGKEDEEEPAEAAAAAASGLPPSGEVKKDQ
ncbi:hypothetical protein, partial [Sporisorium scitamineum]